MYIIKHVILGPRTKDNQSNYTGQQVLLDEKYVQ